MSSATAPTLTATASAVDQFVFYTYDGGTTWYGFTAGQALRDVPQQAGFPSTITWPTKPE